MAAVPALDASAVFRPAVALHFPVFLVALRFWLHLVAGVVGGVGAGLAIALMATGTVGPERGRAIAGPALAACALSYGIAFVTALRHPRPAATPSDQRTAGRKVSA